jgi:hypothetical protein
MGESGATHDVVIMRPTEGSSAASGRNDGRPASIGRRRGRGPGGHEDRSVRPRADESSKPRNDMATSDILHEQLLALIAGHDAHLPFDAAVADFPDDAINRLPPNRNRFATPPSIGPCLWLPEPTMTPPAVASDWLAR